jgi:hypothetical protein
VVISWFGRLLDYGLENFRNLFKIVRLILIYLYLYFFRLLFVTFTDRENLKIPDELYNSSNLKPLPLSKNLANVWSKYP